MPSRPRPIAPWILCGVLVSGCGSLLGIDELNFDSSSEAQGTGGQGGATSSDGGAQTSSSGTGGQCESILDRDCSTAEDCHSDCDGQVLVCEEGQCKDDLRCSVVLAAEETIMDVAWSNEFVLALVLDRSGPEDTLRLHRYHRDNCAHDATDDRSSPITFDGKVDIPRFRAQIDVPSDDRAYVAWQAEADTKDPPAPSATPHDCRLARWGINDPQEPPRLALTGAPCSAGTLNAIAAVDGNGLNYVFVSAESLLDGSSHSIIHRFVLMGDSTTYSSSAAITEGEIADLTRLPSGDGSLLAVGSSAECEDVTSHALTTQQVRNGQLGNAGQPVTLPEGGCTFKLLSRSEDYTGSRVEFTRADQLTASQPAQSIAIDGRETNNEESAVLTQAIGGARLTAARSGGSQEFALTFSSDTPASKVAGTPSHTVVGGATQGSVLIESRELVLGAKSAAPFVIGLDASGGVQQILALPTAVSDDGGEPTLVALAAEEVANDDSQFNVVVAGRTSGATVSFGQGTADANRDFILIYQFGPWPP